MSFLAAQNWLVDELSRLVGDHFRTIEPGPGEWSEAYLDRVIQEVPCIKVAFNSAQNQNPQSNQLTLNSVWSIYILSGQSGTSRRARQSGTAATIGSFLATDIIMPIMHNSLIPDVGRIAATGVDNLWSRTTDENDIALFAVGLNIPMPLDPDEAKLQLAEFLTAGVGWRPQGGGEDAEDVHVIRPPA